MRPLTVALLLCSLPGVVFAATTVVVNGATATVPAVESGGKVYLDPVTLMQLLGGKATYDAANHRVIIFSNTGTSAATPVAAANWGTPQMPGDNGQVGQVYSLRKGEPLAFRLNSAQFTHEQVVIGEQCLTAKAAEKLLVLHFSVQNPAPQERLVRWDSLRFTVVDAQNVNHEAKADWGDEQSRQRVELQLKPAQRLDLFTVVTVPAAGPVPKLIVQSPQENDGPVLRYDLRGRIQGLQPPVADPADPSGATALATVPAQFAMPCPLDKFTLRLDKTEYVTTALQGEAPAEGARYFVATITMRNATTAEALLRGDTIAPVLSATDGTPLAYKGMLGATADQALEQQVPAGQELQARIVFTVPANAKAAKLALREGESRAYEFALPTP